MVPETDFPDIRYRCAIHSHNGSCMIIPREGDLIRLYIQLSDKDVLDPSTGRVDRNKMSPEILLEVRYIIGSDTRCPLYSSVE
jgi:phenol 2-monooxygenase (NADPH)